jgi:hypothetical protein
MGYRLVGVLALVALSLASAMPAAASGPATASPVRLVPERQGIPFGPQHLPPPLFDGVYTGTVWIASPSTVIAQLNAARRAGARVMLNLSTTKGSQNADGTFSLALWRQRVDRFNGIDVDPYVADGTLLGHYVIDEPHSKPNWGGRPVPFADVEAAARYSKELWPRMTTFVRSHPEFLEGAPFRWQHVDAAWAQYSARRGDVTAYLERSVASAKRLGLGLVVGLNLLTGGTAESGIAGYHPGKWAMSASQIRALGRVLAAEPYACAFSMWKYDKTDASYLERGDIKTAIAEIGRVAADRPATSCRVRQ